ncbi:hypothetical protein DYB32_001525 [Aphanomyces invadans]|uniref:FAM21/CAPZIP domain-containing protein n=1 Tax=Aphanomyces invadans TaxID=157072 RepID=A0A3R6ZVB9_9STRA|nr:hypothetical protein DYB32_001525 [Aphanomyces invadans]
MSAVATWEKILPQQGNDWTLAEDAALASQLKLFSQQLFAKTKELENSIWELGLAAEKSDVRLNNTINHFLMLSDSQFIENRVYEEDEDEIVKDEMKTTTEPSSTATTAPGESTTTDSKDVATEDAKKKEIQVVDQYRCSALMMMDHVSLVRRTALTLGMEALKLFAVGDEEDVLDIYNERPLPFVIGTKEFLEDEYLGLGAAPDSDDENDEDESGEDYSSEEEESEEEESEEDEEEGSEEEESDEESIEPVQAKRPPMPPMPPPRPSEEWENESTDDLFGHRTPKPRAQASAAPSRRGLFGMDDDDDDDSDDSHPGPSTSKAKSNSLFAPEDLGRDLFDGKPSAAAPAPPPKLDLFGELRARAGKTRVASDDDSDEGLFGSSSKPPARQPSAAATPAGLSLFGESDSDAESSSSGLFGRQTSTAKDLKRPPPGAVPLPQQLTRADSNDSSLFGTTTRPRAEAKQPANAKSSKLLFDSDDDSDDGGGLFGVASKAPVPPAASIAAAQPKATPPVPAKTASAKATSPSSFFNDGSDDDSDDGLLFGSKPTPPPEKLQPPIQSQPQMPPIQRPLPTAVPPKASAGGSSL